MLGRSVGRVLRDCTSEGTEKLPKAYLDTKRMQNNGPPTVLGQYVTYLFGGFR